MHGSRGGSWGVWTLLSFWPPLPPLEIFWIHKSNQSNKKHLSLYMYLNTLWKLVINIPPVQKHYLDCDHLTLNDIYPLHFDLLTFLPSSSSTCRLTSLSFLFPINNTDTSSRPNYFHKIFNIIMNIKLTSFLSYVITKFKLAILH